ncbi:protein OXIDATIVE STRESS 3 LIKE 2-like [Tasmannia lanceolata]|uniref:protein OXIDATIVE STRESS 3 LIKE 2-like n=1 Tax=Tasmannia lanceolata TaxID=3420 RepID=UPI00406468F7
MSIALERSSNRIEGSGFIRGISTCMSIFEAPESGRKIGRIMPEKTQFPADNMRPKEEREESASCSSSIGKNSDCSMRSSESEDSGEDSGEIQSSYKGPLETMDALEESLPTRRSISKFYCGKSKSFASLADVSSSIKDLAKPENAYNRKRKNLLAFSIFCDKNHNNPLRNTGGISKRPANSSRSTLALAVAMSSSESNTSEDHEPRLPPLHPQGKSPINVSPLNQWSFSNRSFSLTDLQGATGCSSIAFRDKQKKFH